MAIVLVDGETELSRFKESVDGKQNELVVSDRAVYFEAHKSGLSMGVLGILFASLFQWLGILGMYAYLQNVHRFAYIPLEQLDRLEVNKKPRSGFTLLGFLMLLVSFALGTTAAMGGAFGEPSPMVYLIGLFGLVGNFVIIALMIVFRRAEVVVGTGGATYSYSSTRSVDDLRSLIVVIAVAKRKAASGPAPGAGTP